MSWFDGTCTRLRLLFARRATERRMEEEFQFHIEMETERLGREAGLEPQEARRRALVSFGGVDRHKEKLRDGRGWGWISGLSLDLKLGFRMLVKYPGLTVICGLTLAFAISVGTATFELVDRMIHPSLPLPEGDRIVGLNYWDRAENEKATTLLDDFLRWREELTTVDDIGAFRTVERNLSVGTGGGEPVRVSEISAAAFRVTRTPPLLGRTLVEADEEPGAAPVLVLGHDVWQTRFGRDLAVVGRVVRLGDAQVTVVGVMPEGFTFPVNHALWTPLQPGELRSEPGQGPSVRVYGRLAPGATMRHAQAEATTLAAQTAADFPERYDHLRAEVRPYAESIVGNFAAGDVSLPAVIYAINVFPALFLILVCANVALLMFARAAAREREIVVRNALGAGRSRIVSQLFLEALVLSTLAMALGLPAAGLVFPWGLSAIFGVSGPFWMRGALSPTTMIYAGLLALLSAIIAGVIPALKVTGRNMETRLRQASAGGGGPRMGGMLSGLIVAQISATVIFTAVAYLVQRQTAELTPEAVRFQAQEYLAIQFEMVPESPTEVTTDTGRERFLQRYAAMVEELERRLAANPVVEGVTVAERLPLLDQSGGMIELDDGGAAWMPPNAPGYRVNTAAVALNFFEVFQAPIVSGRAFDSRDAAEGMNTIVVNQSFVDHILGGRSPIGRRARYTVAPDEQPGPWYEIVGVVRNPVEYRLSVLADADVRAQLYHPLSPSRPVRYPLYLAVHVRGDPTTAAPVLRRIAQDVGPSLRLDIQTIDQVASDDASFWIFMRNLVLLASAIALFLSLAGIYSVMSFTVSRRTREIGVRVALGAQAAHVVAETFRRPLRLVAAGVIVGCVLVGAMMAFLFETFTNNWWEVAQYGLEGNAKTLVMAKGVALLLAFGIAMMTVCTLACVGPTRRALRVQPTEALREER